MRILLVFAVFFLTLGVVSHYAHAEVKLESRDSSKLDKARDKASQRLDKAHRAADKARKSVDKATKRAAKAASKVKAAAAYDACVRKAATSDAVEACGEGDMTP